MYLIAMMLILYLTISSTPILEYFVGTPTWQQTGNSSNGPLLPQDIQQAMPTNSAD
jgi:hypothetical protein